MPSVQRCVRTYYDGPPPECTVWLVTPSCMAIAYQRLREAHPDILRHYALTFYDETSQELRQVGACGPAWKKFFAIPLPGWMFDTNSEQERDVDTAAASLRASGNSFYAPWPRQRPGVSCVFVRKTEMGKASTELARMADVGTGVFCRR